MNKGFFSKTLTLLLVLTLLSVSFTENKVYANDLQLIEQISVEELDNGDYIETIITSDSFDIPLSSVLSTMSSSKTITKTKTATYKNSAGTVLWSVSIKATFTYNGNTSKCTSCSHSTTAPSKDWSIKSCTSSKSGNKATAKAVAIHTIATGSSTITKSVTISCSPSGKVS